MSAKILNGEAIANDLRKQIRQQISAQRSKSRRAPALAVVLIGDDPASHIYVRNKKRACQEVGISAIDHSLPDSTSQEYLLNLITKLNLDPNIDGILVQLPLPAHIEPLLILDKIDPHKDVDGFHPYNLGRLAQGHPLLSPCTPAGIMQLLQHTKAELRGKIAVMVGISNIVGMPMI